MVDEEAPDAVPVPHALVPHLNETAILLDIDGTLLDIAPTPRSVVVPPELIVDLSALREKCDGALAVVSGRALEDIDRLFAPLKFAAAGAHGAMVRIDPNGPVSHIQRPIPAALRAEFTALAYRNFADAAAKWLTGEEPFVAKLHPELAPYADYDQLMRLDEWYGRQGDGA